MTDHTDEFVGLCAALAAGNIEPRDRQRLAEHIAEGCLECDVALADFEQATLLMAASAPSASPSPGLRERVLEAGAAPRLPAAARAGVPAPAGSVATPDFSAKAAELRRRRRTFAPPPWAGFAAAGFFALVAIVATVVAILAQGEIGRLRAEGRGSTQIMAALNDQLQQEKTWVAVLSSPDARLAELKPTPQGDVTLRARATYDPQSQRAVFVFENLQQMDERVFELWAVIDRTPQSLGVIKTDERGRGVMRVGNVGDPNRLNAFEVSLEKPGAPHGGNGPAGPIVLIGRIQG